MYEDWEGGSFPCIRVQKSTDLQNTPRCVLLWMMSVYYKTVDQFLQFVTYLANSSKSFFACLCHITHPFVYRIIVRVSGEAGMDSTGVAGVGLNRDLGLGSMSMENPCELREKNSSPFSSNRTMFETEEVDIFCFITVLISLVFIFNILPHLVISLNL